MARQPKVIHVPNRPGSRVDDDSDSEMWKDLKYYFGQRRHQALEANTTLIKSAPQGWTRFSEYHFGRDLLGVRLDYWPSRNKWRWKGETKHGDFTSLMNFIKNREKKAATA